MIEREGFDHGVENGTMLCNEPKLNLQVVAIDYKKMVRDAIRRNHAIFHRLGTHD